MLNHYQPPPAASLSLREAHLCMDFASQALGCPDLEAFGKMLQRFAGEIGACFSTCLLAPLQGPLDLGRLLTVNVSYPEAWLALYAQRRFFEVDPVVRKNFYGFGFQDWEETYRNSPPDPEFLNLAWEHGLRRGYSFGLPDREGREGSLFSFSGDRIGEDSRTKAVLQWVLPHFHVCLCALKGSMLTMPGSADPRLSEREKEVLRWVGAGKTSWEIGQILRISERTVNYHVGNAMTKLDVVSRTQAVASAMRLGLLRPE